MATRTKLRRSLVLVILSGLVLAATALAHTEGNTEFLDSGGSWCMLGRAAINGEQSELAATVWSYEEGCTAFKSKDPYHLRTKANVLKEGNDGVFDVCAESSFGYNTTHTYATSNVDSWGGNHGPCGEGKYKSGGHQGLYHNGDWKAGSVRSPAHHW